MWTKILAALCALMLLGNSAWLVWYYPEQIEKAADTGWSESWVKRAQDSARTSGYIEGYQAHRRLFDMTYPLWVQRIADSASASIPATTLTYLPMSVSLPDGGLFTVQSDGSWFYRRGR